MGFRSGFLRRGGGRDCRLSGVASSEHPLTTLSFAHGNTFIRLHWSPLLPYMDIQPSILFLQVPLLESISPSIRPPFLRTAYAAASSQSLALSTPTPLQCTVNPNPITVPPRHRASRRVSSAATMTWRRAVLSTPCTPGSTRRTGLGWFASGPPWGQVTPQQCTVNPNPITVHC
jgi:hypothetical protein